MRRYRQSRYRSYKFQRRHERPLPHIKKTKARQRLEDQQISGHFLFIFRVAMSLAFLFTVRVAVAEAQDGFLWSSMGYASLASTCILLAVLLKFNLPGDGKRDEEDD